MKEEMIALVKQLQQDICQALEQIDGQATFKEDAWERPGGGGGWSRVIQNGGLIEKGGVNVSIVTGELPQAMQQKFNVDKAQFFATGVSLVIHPNNPHCPTSHANWRYFELYDDEGQVTDAWFGGGLDLTPYYIVDEDVIHWHQVCKTACDAFDVTLYPKFKKWCDDYFYNTHRQEARGVGGLFFDYLRDGDDGFSLEQWFQFVSNIGHAYLSAYLPILEKHKDDNYSESQRYWQEIRRGRYVEFNLIHDRGTLFGLKTNGRTESILMSLPPMVRWDYDFEARNEAEAYLIEVLKNPRNWV